MPGRLQRVLSAYFHHYIPASLYGGQTAFPTLARIEQALEQCTSADCAAEALGQFKTNLYDQLRTRFDSPVAQAFTVKILNLLMARHHLRTRSIAVLSRPFGLMVDPSNMCQLACPGCVHSTSNETFKIFDWPKGTLSQDRLSALLKLYGPYAIGVYFYNYGEPLLNLRTPQLIRMAKQYLLNTALSTSLSVSRFDAEAYVESGLDYMSLSIDGATQPIYERFRRRGELGLVLDNIRKLVEAKRKLRKRTPVVSWNYLAFEHNVHEIPAASRLARKLGVDQFRILNPFDVQWDDPEMRPATINASVRRFFSFSISGKADVPGPFAETLDCATIARAFEGGWHPQPASGAAPAPGHTCHWLYKNMVMDATGRILPCCGGPRPDINLVFGTFDGDGRDPFNSERYRQARAWFSGEASATDDEPHCTHCEWDQEAVNIGGQQIREYFRNADTDYFDTRSLQLLSGW